MKKTLDDFGQFIESAGLAGELRSELHNYAARFLRDFERLDFQIKRTVEDKAIVVNLLNRTIEDIRTHQTIVEKANQELYIQKQEIEAKNVALQRQKMLLEEQSQRLEENLLELERSYTELEQFSYIASHDLKSPLRTIASYAGLLKRRYGGHLDAEASEFLDFIVKGASHMDEIIRDLLEYSRSDKVREFNQINLNEVLDLVKFNLHEEILENKAVIEYQTLPVLCAHKSGMLQLFQNLVANAIKFRSDLPPVLSIEHYQDKHSWHFSISDNGMGIDETFQDRVFQPFQRISNLDHRGTGMGLAICRKIVKMHHGEIWYESKAGEGTTFYFTLSKEYLNERKIPSTKKKKNNVISLEGMGMV